MLHLRKMEVIGTQSERSAHDQHSAQCRSDDASSTDYSKVNSTAYKPDDDTYWNENLTDWSFNSTSSLYKSSRVSVRATAVSVLSIAVQCNFSKICR